jgi:uncharacterized membrane protein (DUF485 family)
MKPAHDDDHPDLTALNARSGLWLFALYTAIYVLFMVLSAFSVETMAQPTPLGPNVAILYGFGLILGAIVLALVYMVLCQWNARMVGIGNGERGTGKRETGNGGKTIP